jgi:hypothetical protein
VLIYLYEPTAIGFWFGLGGMDNHRLGVAAFGSCYHRLARLDRQKNKVN